MPAKVKGQPTEKLKPSRARQTALGPLADLPPVTVPLAEVQKEAARVRHEYPGIDDDTLSLVILHISTGSTVAAIARMLGASKTWAYTRWIRPEVQKLVAELAMSLLGVAASRAIRNVQQLAETSNDEGMRFKASQALLDRAGLGNSSAAPQATSPARQGFAFTFGAAPPKGDGTQGS